MLSTILQILIALFVLLILISFRSIRKNGSTIGFTYTWAFLIGGFVWEDVLIFSLYALFASITTLIVWEYRLWILFFLVFWMVRSAGETLYFFLQQFIVPKHHPHDIDGHFSILRKVCGSISHQQCLIIMQVFFQSILMTSIVCLVLLLRSW